MLLVRLYKSIAPTKNCAYRLMYTEVFIYEEITAKFKMAFYS